MIRDAWRLSVGTFTAIPTQAPNTVDIRRAGLAVLLSPLAFVPVAAVTVLVLHLGKLLAVPNPVLAVLGVCLLVLGNRAFHMDGLADTADALTSSYDRERALEVARLGNVGPAGVAAIVFVIFLQLAGVASLLSHDFGPLAVGTLAALARLGSSVGLLKGLPAARDDGMGATFAGSVPVAAAQLAWLLLTAAAGGIAVLLGLPVWQGMLAALLTLVAILLLVHRSVHRFGGVIGDVLGASVEISFAVLLLVLSAG